MDIYLCDSSVQRENRENNGVFDRFSVREF